MGTEIKIDETNPREMVRIHANGMMFMRVSEDTWVNTADAKLYRDSQGREPILAEDGSHKRHEPMMRFLGVS